MADIDIYKAKLPQDNTNLYRFRDGVIEPLVDTSYEETDYANPLTLETLQAQTAKNTKVKIEPIQDLHGYPKPWVGGAGKNIAPITVADLKVANTAGTWNGNAYTLFETTFTLVTDQDNNVIGIKINSLSTADGNRDFRIGGAYGTTTNLFAPSGTYTLSLEGANSSIVGLGGYGNNVILNNTTMTTGSCPDGVSWFLVRLNQGANVSNITVKPMLRKSTETDATFAPYSNICSISGYDQIDIDGCGKNLLNLPNVTQTGCTVVTNEDGSISITADSSTRYPLWLLTGLLNEGTYTFKVYDGSQNAYVQLSGDSDYSHNISAGNSFTFEYDGSSYLRILLSVSANTTSVYKLQLEKGSIASDFEPYTQSNNLSIDFPSTVYGGVLDLESGEVVVDRAYKIYDGSSDENWFATEDGRFRIDNLVTSKGSSTINCISNLYVSDKADNIYINRSVSGYIGIGTNGAALILVDNIKFASKNISEFKTYLAGNNLEVCYILATSFTLYISPEHLKLLKAQNTITTSQYTQVKVTYRNGVFATLEELSDTAKDIYDEISGDATTVSGNPINFITREKQKSKSTIIDLEPIQDLHGFNKPWVGGAGKNLLQVTASNTTSNGITFTINKNEQNEVVSINTYGTSTNSAYIKLGIPNLKAGTYKFYVFSPNLGNNWYADIPDSSHRLYHDGDTFTVANDGNTDVWFNIISGVTVNNILFYPMIIKSSDTVTSFEPYSNICPISGRSSVDIDGCGKNLLPKSTLNGTIDGVTFTVNDDGSIIANGTASALVIYNITLGYWRTFLKAGTYILSGVTGGSNSTYDMRIMIDASQYPAELFNGDLVFTLDKDTQVSPRIIIRNGYKAENLKFYPMIRSASNTNGEFEPYTPSNDLTISFGTTVYGGRLDVEKGELVVNKGYKLFNGTETWSVLNYGHVATQISNMKSGTNQDGICSILETGDSSGRMQFGSGSNYIYIMNASGVYGIDTNEKAQAFTNGMQIAYPLATPIEIQLTPNEISLLKGVNNISTTADGIKLTYRNGMFATLEELSTKVDKETGKGLSSNDYTDSDKAKVDTIEYKFGVENGIPYIEEL